MSDRYKAEALSKYPFIESDSVGLVLSEFGEFGVVARKKLRGDLFYCELKNNMPAQFYESLEGSLALEELAYRYSRESTRRKHAILEIVENIIWHESLKYRGHECSAANGFTAARLIKSVPGNPEDVESVLIGLLSNGIVVIPTDNAAESVFNLIIQRSSAGAA